MYVRDNPDKIRLVDLFAGCGGLSAGFAATGRYETVAAVESDLAAAATYAENFGEDHIVWGDINDWVAGDLPKADMVVGGPPCQGFSNLGKKFNRDPKNALWRRYVEALVKIEPQVFLMENVDRFRTSGQFRDLRRETYKNGRLRDYVFRSELLVAADFGAAQLRKRTIIIGTHRDLAPIELPERQVSAHSYKTVRDAFMNLPSAIHPGLVELPEIRQTYFGKEVSGPYDAFDLHVTRAYQRLSRKRFMYIPEGGNRRNLPDSLKARCWIEHDSGSGDVMGRLRWEKPSVTIRTEFYKPEKGRYLHPEENRALTLLEAARLQGFPDDFRWCGSKDQIARQIGNAVPVPLAQALATYLADELARASTPMRIAV